MKRPLAAVVSAYVIGLLLAEIFQLPLAALFACALAVLGATLVFAKCRPWLIWPLLALAGWVNFAVHTRVVSPQDLRRLLSGEPELVTVRGTLAETPGQRVYVRDEIESWRTLARLEVTALARGTNWQPAGGQIIVTTPGKLPADFFQGQEVEIAGIIAWPPIPVAEGLFDYRTFLRRQGIDFQLKSGSANDWKLLSTRTTPPASDRFLAWSQATLGRGLPEVDEPLKLLWAMTLGWRPALTGEVTAPFMESGTMHIFAISGLHIALIAGILVAILRAMQLPRFGCGAVIIPLIWFYTAATGWQPSAIRSTLMMTIVIGGWMLKRPGDLLNSLAAAAFIILLCDPRQLFQASFQLSFFVVLSIALFMPPLEKFCDRLLAEDPMLPQELLPRWRRWLNAALRPLLTWLAVSFAAWLGSWPLCAYYFHLFSPVTLLANLLIVPLSSAALACNLGSLICGGWLPWATELFNHSGWLWMKLMVDISHALVKLPHAFFYVSGPAPADFVIYYGALFAMLSGAAGKPAWRIPVGIGLVFIAGFYGWRWHAARQTTTLTILPLNGGSAVFVRDGQSSGSLLVDCGDTNAVEFITRPFLHAQGVNHLPRLALTQGDLRDIGGARLVGDAFSVDEVFTSAVRFRSPAYRQTLAALERKPGGHKIVNRGDAIGSWQVLYPSATNNFPQADDNSLVLQGEIHGVKILLLSDLGRRGQEILVNQGNDLRADILVSGLPEKTPPLSEALLEKIQPGIIVVADSEFPATRRASRELQDRLGQRQVPVIYTREAGAVTLGARPGGWKLRTMSGQTFTDRAIPDLRAGSRPALPPE
jgi:competence protein ComEC